RASSPAPAGTPLRQHWDDDAERQHVEQHSDEDEDEGGAARRSGLRFGHQITVLPRSFSSVQLVQIAVGDNLAIAAAILVDDLAEILRSDYGELRSKLGDALDQGGIG